jgi:hypothetical protein
MSFEATLPALEYCGRPPATSTKAWRAERPGLVDRPAIVVARLDAMRGIGDKHAAAAIA